MNRRGLLKLSGQAAIGMMAARFAFGSSSPSLHPAIQANIDYWMKACPEWLSECPPYHTSYYAVKENSALRVYAVKWNGPDLNNHKVSVPDNERELIAQAQQAIDSQSGHGYSMDIGDVIYCSDGRPYRFCSYCYDSPLRRIKKWGGSLSTSLLAYNEFHNLKKEHVSL